MQALGLVRISKNIKCTHLETEGETKLQRVRIDRVEIDLRWELTW